MTKEKQNERFDGGVEGLFRYHRSLHLLLCCLLTPLLAANLHLFWVPPGAGPMPFADFISSLILITAWLFSGQYFIIVMAELILYASDGSPTEKAARWRSALWDRIKIDLGFWAGVVALLSLLHALAGGLKPNFDLPLLKSFLFITFGFYPLVKIALARQTRHRAEMVDAGRLVLFHSLLHKRKCWEGRLLCCRMRWA